MIPITLLILVASFLAIQAFRLIPQGGQGTQEVAQSADIVAANMLTYIEAVRSLYKWSDDTVDPDGAGPLLPRANAPDVPGILASGGIDNNIIMVCNNLGAPVVLRVQPPTPGATLNPFVPCVLPPTVTNNITPNLLTSLRRPRTTVKSSVAGNLALLPGIRVINYDPPEPNRRSALIVYFVNDNDAGLSAADTGNLGNVPQITVASRLFDRAIFRNPKNRSAGISACRDEAGGITRCYISNKNFTPDQDNDSDNSLRILLPRDFGSNRAVYAIPYP